MNCIINQVTNSQDTNSQDTNSQDTNNQDSNKLLNNNKYLDFKDVLIIPKSSKINSRSEVNLDTIYKFNNINWKGIPIVSANMTTTGTFELYNILSKYKIITAFNKFYKLHDYKNYITKSGELDQDYFMVSTGISDDDFANLNTILNNIECKFICIDIANGYISNFYKFCNKVRITYPDKIIMAGNVCTREGVANLIKCGVDIIKAGIGGGSACTTRIQTGIGVPQLSCIMECRDEIDKYKTKKIYLLSDGGITCPGDCAKAYSAGADFVMIGGEFSGHDENPGEIIEEDGKKFKLFYGMSSQYAMDNNYNTKKDYRSSEGRVIKIKYKGELTKTVNNYLGGLRSTCSYTDSKCLSELFNNTKFILVNNQFNNHLL